MDNLRTMLQYLNQGEFLRTIADETADRDHQRALYSAAGYYQKMAATIERELRNVPLQRHWI